MVSASRTFSYQDDFESASEAPSVTQTAHERSTVTAAKKRAAFAGSAPPTADDVTAASDENSLDDTLTESDALDTAAYVAVFSYWCTQTNPALDVSVRPSKQQSPPPSAPASFPTSLPSPA